MRTVLLVSYTFPPQYDISAKRAAKLCKYLPRVGWKPLVLTKDWRSGATVEDRRRYAIVQNEHALAELTHVEIELTPYGSRDNVLRRWHSRLGGRYHDQPSDPADAARADEPATFAAVRSLARRIMSAASPLYGDFPDEFRGWERPAVDAGVALAARRDVAVICSLCPPASAHVVASEISRRTGIPWVALFDDLFSFYLESERRASWRWYSSHMHRRWMRQAAVAGAITPGMLEYVRRTYGIDGDLVMVGFDPDESPSVPPSRGDRLRLVYTGSVYPDDHRPELFFEALERVLASRLEAERLIEVVFAGTRQDAALKARLAAFPLAARACKFLDRVSPEAALRLQREAHGLILFNYTSPSARNGTLSFPAKSFEYLNAGRPILALPRDPGGWGDALLASTGAGVTANSPAEAVVVLDGWLGHWWSTGSLPYAAIRPEIARYAQPAQAAALGHLLDKANAKG
ncbi:MAG TPA: hypothetical protein VM076_02775 [Gemmatimonadaceae bacterium]|nr:hypothetical protein [Gemmatimonadaceae bacterium]